MDDNVKLPVDVSELGEVVAAKMECPGIYYVAVLPAKTVMGMCDEYYIVTKDAPISQAARQYGRPFGGALLYEIDADGSGEKIVEYEVGKYLIAHNLPLDGDDLHTISTYGSELYPAYFGPLAPPLQTPWGCLTRHRVLSNGIFFVETDEAKEGLAVAYPIWSADLTDTTIKLGVKTAYDEALGIDNTLGYMFFAPNTMPVVFFELVIDHEDWISDGTINIRALKNAIWACQPEYAMEHNMRVQSLCDSDVQASRLIAIDPNVGTDYLTI